MKFIPVLPYLPELPQQLIHCSGIGLPNPKFNLRYQFVWHWDVLGEGKFGPGYSISEYLTGYNLTHGHKSLDDAIQEALDKLTSGDISIRTIYDFMPQLNHPDNYFLN